MLAHVKAERLQRLSCSSRGCYWLLARQRGHNASGALRHGLGNLLRWWWELRQGEEMGDGRVQCRHRVPVFPEMGKKG